MIPFRNGHAVSQIETSLISRSLLSLVQSDNKAPIANISELEFEMERETSGENNTTAPVRSIAKTIQYAIIANSPRYFSALFQQTRPSVQPMIR